MTTLTRGLWIIIGATVVLLPALPMASWVGAPDQGPVWGPHVEAWLIGTVVVAVLAFIAGRAATDVRLPSIRAPNVRPWVWLTALAGGFTALSATAMRTAFASNPHLIDEFAQLFQARAFAAGRLAAPSPEPSEFFLVAQTLVTDAGWVSQYPPGQPLLFALGMPLGAEWLVNPVLGGISVLLIYVLARGLYGPKTARVATFLWAASAWVLFMSATYMNHVGATTIALAAWALVWGPRRPTRWHAVATGLLLSAVAAIRPLDAVAAAAPIAAWVVARRRAASVPWMVLGALPVGLAMAYWNWRFFGDPRTFGYVALYGPAHGLGFHVDPFGHAFTPLTALSNLAVAIRRLHIYVYEWPIPALLPLAAWALFARRHGPGDFVLAVGALAGPVLYFFYWHSGFYPGPRLYYIAAPFLVLATARAWRWAWARARRIPRRRVRWDAALATAAVVVLMWGWGSLLPARWSAYREQLPSLKYHPERQLAAAGIEQALVLVPESWTSRIVTNLWGLGARRDLVDQAVRRVDACDLHLLNQRARRENLNGEEIADSLELLMTAGGAPPGRIANWPDPSLRLRAREAMPDECRVEMQRDLDGFTLYGNLVWRNPVGLRSSIVFARDLYEQNDALLTRYGGWAVWRYAPPAGDPDAPPVLTEVRRDGAAHPRQPSP